MGSEIEDVRQLLRDIGLTDEEIDREVKSKVQEGQGYITEDFALFVVAKENDINVGFIHGDSIDDNDNESEVDYNEFTIKGTDIKEGMRSIVLLGRIEKIFKQREFLRKDGTVGKVSSFFLNDGSGSVKIVLWDDKSSVVDSEYFKHNEIVRVIGGYSKKEYKDSVEVHLSKRGKMEMVLDGDCLEKIPPLSSVPQYNSGKISIRDLQERDGFVNQVEGMVSAKEFKEITLKNGEISFLFKFLLSDDESSISVVVWGLNAVNLFKLTESGFMIRLRNLFAKKNAYSGQKELNFIKKTSFEIF